MNPVNRVQAALDKISGKGIQPVPGRPPVEGAAINGIQVCTAGPLQSDSKVDAVVLRVGIMGLPIPAVFVWHADHMDDLRGLIAELQAAVAQVEANR